MIVLVLEQTVNEMVHELSGD